LREGGQVKDQSNSTNNAKKEGSQKKEKKEKRKDTLIKIVPADRFTPFALAKKLGARMILESSSYQKGRDRYSLIMVKEAFHLVQKEGEMYMRPVDGPALEGIRPWKKQIQIKSAAQDILDLQMYFANQHHEPHQDFPFPAGGIGYLSYEFAQYCDTIHFQDREDPLETPRRLLSSDMCLSCLIIIQICFT
jgi:anthranilate synthase component 1